MDVVSVSFDLEGQEGAAGGFLTNEFLDIGKRAGLIVDAQRQVVPVMIPKTEAADGRPKRHNLLMLMDEFPLLGRVSFFEKSLRLLSG